MEKIVFDPLAKQELENATTFYENCQKGLGQKFLNAVESATDTISHFPYLFPILQNHFRRCLIRKFPFGIVYSIEKETIYVISVMHLKRKPGYWTDRVKE